MMTPWLQSVNAEHSGPSSPPPRPAAPRPDESGPVAFHLWAVTTTDETPRDDLAVDRHSAGPPPVAVELRREPGMLSVRLGRSSLSTRAQRRQVIAPQFFPKLLFVPTQIFPLEDGSGVGPDHGLVEIRLFAEFEGARDA